MGDQTKSASGQSLRVQDRRRPVARPVRARLDIIAPCFNEIDALDGFFDVLSKTMKTILIEWRIVFVDDGSTDGTSDALIELAERHDNVLAVLLSRNFGKEAAMSAGLDIVDADAVIVIDTDLQDPPDLIADFIQKWREGYDVVYGKRVDRTSDSFLKRETAGKFYSLFNKISGVKIPENTGDFRLMDRRVVEAVKQLPERSRFMKGLFAWVGYRSFAVEYARPERAAGETKFNYWRLWNFAIDGVVSFSSAPLRIWSYVGAAIAGLAFLYASFIILYTMFTGGDLPGYGSILTAVLFLGGVQIISIGVLGEYISRLFVEAKQRPIYLIDEIIGAQTQAAPRLTREDRAVTASSAD